LAVEQFYSFLGQLICFFSCYRNPYAYTHPCTYDYIDQYKAISKLPQRFINPGPGGYDDNDGEDDEPSFFMYSTAVRDLMY
jgi:hypothetical protein